MITSTLAKTEDGTVQITFTIPFETLAKAREDALKEYAKDIDVPGFRKGKAPLEKIRQRVPEGSLIEHTLSHLLPKALGQVISENKIRPAIYPKFELIKAKEDEAWEVRALTCEVPMVELGDYKQSLRLRSKKNQKEPSREEKEQEVIKTLLETIKVNIPKLLIDEEVNARLSSLLDKIEKLGLTLDSYLASLGKTPETLRSEYQVQAKNTIALDLILSSIAQEEKMDIKETEVDAAIKAAGADPKVAERLNTPEQRRLIRGVLARRAALDSLSALL